MPATELSVDALRARVATVLDRRRKALTLEGRIRAAVLVLFVYRAGVPALVFGKKTEDVPHHKGQFSFPGGVVQHTDGSVVEAALREAWEEIRLPAEAVEVLGLLDDTETRATSFIITPVVGIVTEAVDFVPDGREIERVIEVPLETLADPAIFRAETWARGGESHEVYFYQVSPDDLVWGATARIVKQFLDMLAEEARRE